MIFGPSRGELWDRKNSCFWKGLTTGPYYIELAGSPLVSGPGPLAAQMHTRAMLHLVDKPQRAGCRHAQTKRVGAHDALPFATLLLAQTVEGVGITPFTFHRPAVAVLAQEVVGAQGESRGEKGCESWGGFLWPGRWVAQVAARLRTTTRSRRPGNPEVPLPRVWG